MKRFFSVLFLCLLFVSFTIPCFAAEFKNPPVIDGEGLLDEIQFKKISEKLEAIRQKYNLDVAIVTESEMTSYDAVSSADDIYDSYGFGAGSGDDGAMLYICAYEGKYHLTTHGEGYDIFDGDAVADMKRLIEPHLANGDYYMAMDAFADFADKQIDKKRNDPTFMLIVIGCALIIPLLIAYFMMKGKLAKMKTAVENDYAANYVKPGSKRLDVSRDIFLYSHITKTEKPKNNSGGHKSSSGRTHGGGGGSF